MKKGISLVILVITLIVMIILGGVIVINTNYIFVDTNKAKLQVDIAQLEALMDTYKIRNNGNIRFGSVDFDVSALTDEEIEQFSGENIVNNKIKLYVIDLEAIDAENSNYGRLEKGTKDRYLYSTITGKVYYELGLEYDDITYYYSKDGEV